MHPTPEEFDALLSWRDGFPRPDWRRLWDIYCGGADAGGDGDSVAAEVTVQRLWLAVLARHLGGQYRARESRRLFLMSDEDDAAAAERLAHLERVLDAIIDTLEGLGPPGGALPGKLPVVYFSEADDYYAYIADYYPPEGQFGMSCGICLRRDEVHIAVNGAADTPHVTLVHELVHVCLSHLTLPMWLEEGIVAVVEHVATDKPKTESLSRWQRDDQANFWGPVGLQEFWTGEAFHAADDAAGHSYQLAEVMVRAILARRPTDFERFVLAASPEDAGEAAAGAVLGQSLVAVVEHCIGSGPWLPPFPIDKPIPHRPRRRVVTAVAPPREQ